MNVFWSFFLGVCVSRTQRAIRRKAVQAGNKGHEIKTEVTFLQ